MVSHMVSVDKIQRRVQGRTRAGLIHCSGWVGNLDSVLLLRFRVMTICLMPSSHRRRHKTAEFRRQCVAFATTRDCIAADGKVGR